MSSRFTFKVGDRIRAKGDRFPVRAGAIGIVREAAHFPSEWYLVEWESAADVSQQNTATSIWPWDLEYFEAVQKPREES